SCGSPTPNRYRTGWHPSWASTRTRSSARSGTPPKRSPRYARTRPLDDDPARIGTFRKKAEMSELLAGVRVVELATLFNGDTVGAHLGDLGADVIKVEGPPVGDYLRHFLGQIEPGNSPAHVQINRNKRSVAIDLRT